jgi:acyl-CoA reductase-like NAD-dependent aldehyde dehydrogenase
MGLLSTLAIAVDGLTAQYLGCDALWAAVLLLVAWRLWRWLGQDLLGRHSGTPLVVVETREEERTAEWSSTRKFEYSKEWGKSSTKVPCWDPATMDYLGELPVHSADDVRRMVAKARVAQREWANTDFSKRRQLLRVIQRFILANAETIATVACRDSGKTKIDAMVGEILVTLEKCRWTTMYGEESLLPDYRPSGLMNMHKTSRVEWTPVGVVGAIVPWNYPFHNVFNPLIAALFSGNAIIIKVSEYAAWSTKYYGRVIQACLAAVGAPADLVQFAVGYSETGSTLVANADKIIFVGSVGVGKKVMEAAAATLTPVILELGGKDPFIVCDDCDAKGLAQLVVRGAYQNMGQNCAGPERFIVYEKVYKEFCDEVTAIVKTLRQGPPLSSDFVDCGACVHPPSLEGYQHFVDDAVVRGARLLTGGKRNREFSLGQFFEPTVLADVTEDMLVAQEEIFGPILCIFRVKNNDDREAIRLANKCSFALSSCAHSADNERARRICAQLEAGMSSVNDIEGTTYLSQSLPFGGHKGSGFGRFAGAEGLRGLCNERSIVENRLSFLKPSIPRPLAYPANGKGPSFCLGLNQVLYGHSLLDRLRGVFTLTLASLPVSGKP